MAVLEGGPRHGYAVIERLPETSGRRLDLPTGTIYPALYRLEEADLIEGSWSVVGGRRRGSYALTESGVRKLPTGGLDDGSSPQWSAQRWRQSNRRAPPDPRLPRGLSPAAARGDHRRTGRRPGADLPAPSGYRAGPGRSRTGRSGRIRRPGHDRGSVRGRRTRPTLRPDADRHRTPGRRLLGHTPDHHEGMELARARPRTSRGRAAVGHAIALPAVAAFTGSYRRGLRCWPARCHSDAAFRIPRSRATPDAHAHRSMRRTEPIRPGRPGPETTRHRRNHNRRRQRLPSWEPSPLPRTLPNLPRRPSQHSCPTARHSDPTRHNRCERTACPASQGLDVCGCSKPSLPRGVGAVMLPM